MGSFFSKYWSSAEYRVFILGLDAAGKQLFRIN